MFRHRSFRNFIFRGAQARAAVLAVLPGWDNKHSGITAADIVSRTLLSRKRVQRALGALIDEGLATGWWYDGLPMHYHRLKG